MPYQPQSAPVGRLSLDSPPNAPPARIKPGDETMSLLGAPNANGEGMGASASTPTGRALGGVMMMMNGANMIESVVPGAIPPPLVQLIQQLSITLPEIVRNMQQMTGPGGLLTSMGMPNGPNGPGGMGGPMGGGMSPMGAGAPIGEGALGGLLPGGGGGF